MKSERLFKDVVKRLVGSGTPPNDNKILEMSLKLACIYSEWKEDAKATSGFQHCITEIETKLKRGDNDENTLALWGMSHDYFAQFLLQRNRFKEALGQFQTAFLTSCEVLGETHPQSVVLVNSLGEKKHPSHFSKFSGRESLDNSFLSELMIPNGPALFQFYMADNVDPRSNFYLQRE